MPCVKREDGVPGRPAVVAESELERGLRGRASNSSKTECPRQTGPIARVSGRDTVPPAKRRWVPPTLRHQDVLSPENQNDLVFRKVRGILNKLTPENFKKLSDDLLGTELNSSVILKGVILLIFEKALDEPKYSSMYAQLCKRLSKEAPNFEPENAPCTFRLLLLNKCRTEFENRSQASEALEHGGLFTPEEEERRQLAKRKMLGNIKFIGELAKLEILSEGILHRCIQQLLDKRRRADTTQDMSEDLECLCQILRTCGRILDTDKGRKLMEQYFERMKVLAENMELPPRIRFMLKDVIELRKDGWVPRKATIVEGPMPINQIRPSDDDSRSASYLMRERRNQEREMERAGNNELFRHRMKMRSGIEDIMAGISISSSSTNLIPTHGDKFPFNPNGYGARDGGYRGHNNQRSGGGGGGGYNMYGSQRGAYKHNQNNQHSNNSNQFNNSSNKDLAPRFKKNLISAREHNLGDVELRPAANFMLFNQASMKAAANLVMNNRPGMDLGLAGSAAKPSLAPVASLHKDSLPIKQAPAEKPKQAKKDKGPNKEEILKKMNGLMDDFLQNSMTVATAVEAFKEHKVPDKFIKDVLLSMLKLTLTKPDPECEKIIKLLNTLRSEGLVTVTTLQDSLKSFCNMLDDTDSEVQKNKEAVAKMLACGVQEHLVPLADVASLTEASVHHLMFLSVLQHLHKNLDKQELSALFNASKVNLMNQLAEADRTKERLAEILDERGLSFLCPLLRIQSELAKQLQSDPQPQQFYKWIKENLDAASTTDAGFISALMTVLFKYILQEAGTDGTGDEPNKAVLERERTLLERYIGVLQQFLHERADLQLTAVYSLQVHWFALGQPKGLLLRWFNALYDLEVIEEETFLQWKDDPPDTFPGKGQALFQVNTWLTWLQEAESDNDEADD